MAIPGKDNGFDIEGLAVDGRRRLLGLRVVGRQPQLARPVRRAWH
jgi:hypothetical protein